MDRRQSKIFGIGLSRTRASSLAQALQKLDYKSKDGIGVTEYSACDLSSIDMDMILAHDALTDTPIPSSYRQLDARFPGSKFILAVCDREGWLESCKKQLNERLAAAQNDARRRTFDDLYGTDVSDKQEFSAGDARFVAGVLNHFRGREQDLHVLDIAARAAHGVLVAGLQELNPSIEVTSPLEEPPALAQRQGWSHVWLIAPMDGALASAAGRGDFSVNTALLEYGQPIYGVVDAPAQGVTHFGGMGQGAFRRVRAGRIEPQVVKSKDIDSSTSNDGVELSNHALNMCGRLRQSRRVTLQFGSVPEWKAAAAHAVLADADLDLVNEQWQAAPNYNSRELLMGPLVFRPRDFA